MCLKNKNHMDQSIHETAQWVKALPTMPEDPCSIPESHAAEGSCPLTSCMLWHVYNHNKQ